MGANDAPTPPTPTTRIFIAERSSGWSAGDTVARVYGGGSRAVAGSAHSSIKPAFVGRNPQAPTPSVSPFGKLRRIVPERAERLGRVVGERMRPHRERVTDVAVLRHEPREMSKAVLDHLRQMHRLGPAGRATAREFGARHLLDLA